MPTGIPTLNQTKAAPSASCTVTPSRDRMIDRTGDRVVKENPSPGHGDQLLPDDLEVLCEIGDSRPGPVGVRALQHWAQLSEPIDDIVRDPADHLACLGPR